MSDLPGRNLIHHGHVPALQLPPQGQRLVDFVPHDYWKTTTFVSGLTAEGFMVPMVLDGPMNADAFSRCIKEEPDGGAKDANSAQIQHKKGLRKVRTTNGLKSRPSENG